MPRSKSLNLEELQALLASYQSQQAQLEFQMRQNAGIIANLEKEREALEKKRDKASPAPRRKATAKRGTTTRRRAAAAKTAGAATTARTVKPAGGRKKTAAARGATKAKAAAKTDATGTAKKTAKTAGTPKAATARKTAGTGKRKPAAAKAKPATRKTKTSATKGSTTPKRRATTPKTAAARKSAAAAQTAAPVKATKADKGGYRLSDWDQVLIEAVNQARQPLKKTDLDALFQGHDLAKKAKMNDEAVYTKVSRVLHKLANKRGILKKVPIEGKGFAYTLA